MYLVWVILGIIAFFGLVAGIRDALKTPAEKKLSPHGEQPGDEIITAFTLDNIQGEWRLISVGRNGNFAPLAMMKMSNLQMRVRGSRYNVDDSGGTLVLKSATNGMEMDQIGDDGDTHLCLSRLRNNQLEVCQAEVGKERPADFNPERSDGASLTRFNRV